MIQIQLRVIGMHESERELCVELESLISLKNPAQNRCFCEVCHGNEYSYPATNIANAPA